MVEWIRSHETMLWMLGALSGLTFLASLVAVPWAIVRLPADYFAQERRRRVWAARHPAVRVALWMVKNVVGCVLVVAGAVMIALPGQGLFVMFVGFMLLEFPGKFRLERWLVARPSVRRSVNWLRQRAGRPPLELDG